MTRVYHVMKKEFIQTFRDPRMVGIIFIAPLIQLFIFGYAITTDIKNVNLGILDRDNTPITRHVVEAFVESGYFTLAGSLSSDDALRQSLHEGTIDVALVFPENFAKDLEAGQQGVIQAIFDASDSNFAIVAGGYTQGIITKLSSDLIDGRIAQIRAMTSALGKTMPDSMPMVNPAMRVWYNPELLSVYYMVPGITCMLLMVVTMMLSGMAVTREREIGTIEQIIVSPIAGWELILGKLAPFGILGMIDVALIVTIGHLHFDVPFRGSIWLLFGSSGLFLFTTLGLGLFFSTISSTQQQAMFVNFMFMMPAILLSGFMFPIENMPDAIQYMTYLNPLRYFLVIVRGLFLKGIGVEELWFQLTALAVLGMTIFGIASARFSKRLA
jgi:ABC-2 type transport system permease protein